MSISILLMLFWGMISFEMNNPKELDVYLGSTPTLDGIISPGEYDDATPFSGTSGWVHYCNNLPEETDLSVNAWVKHDGENLYFAFDVTDDVIYGRDTPRWLPDENQEVHQFEPSKGWPWFGDGIEIFLDSRNNTDISKITGDNAWVVACSTHKSFLEKLNKGGLIDGEPKTDLSWNIYRRWIKSGAMTAVVRIKKEGEGKGYMIEWKIAANPCLEVRDGMYWTPSSGVTKMGINFEIQDLDERAKGNGNFANMHHIEVWDAKTKGKEYIRVWGTMTLHPGVRNPGMQR